MNDVINNSNEEAISEGGTPKKKANPNPNPNPFLTTLRDNQVEQFKAAEDWARRIAQDERVMSWIHAQDYGLYCLLADPDWNFESTIAACGIDIERESEGTNNE